MRRSRCTRSCAARTSSSTRGWPPDAWRAGTRCTSWTNSASVRRSTAASSATGCSSRRSGSAGSRRSAAWSASVVQGRATIARLSLEGLKLLKAYQRLDIEAIAELRLGPTVEREVEAALREFVRDALERDARSLAFLDEVRHAPVPG